MLIAVVAIVLFAASCGGSDDVASAERSTATAAATDEGTDSVTAEQSAQASDPATDDAEPGWDDVSPDADEAGQSAESSSEEDRGLRDQAEQDQAEQDQAEQAATEQDQAERDQAEQAATEQSSSEESTAEADDATPDTDEANETEGPARESTSVVANVGYFETLPPGSPLPSDTACAQAVSARPLDETHPENVQANRTPGGPAVRIDGADEQYNEVLAPRITGNFTGTTEELIRWVACKWGFDEDLTRARAWTESSWSIRTEGDETADGPACDYLGLSSPCFQSYGLLQVKGTVHDGTYPYAHGSTAWGLDYAMAWQRACYEGAFSWLVQDGYAAGDVNGCVGAWYSGEWFDDLAVGYLADVGWNLDNRPWE